MTIQATSQQRSAHKSSNDNVNCIHSTASKLGIDYQGDVNIEHGGTFYNVENWNEYGYCEAVECIIADNAVLITVGSINKLADKKLVGIFETYSTVDFDGMEDSEFIHYEIDYCKSQFGIEADTFNGSEVFELSDCGEYFKTDSGWVSVDDLQGYVIARYVRSIVNA